MHAAVSMQTLHAVLELEQEGRALGAETKAELAEAVRLVRRMRRCAAVASEGGRRSPPRQRRLRHSESAPELIHSPRPEISPERSKDDQSAAAALLFPPKLAAAGSAVTLGLREGSQREGRGAEEPHMAEGKEAEGKQAEGIAANSEGKEAGGEVDPLEQNNFLFTSTL